MRNMHWKIIIILTVLIIGAWSYFDLGLRLGKDLAGGVSFTYEIYLEPNDDADAVVQQVIAVIKNRLNPQGTFDISVTRQGRNRIEIVMPLPTEEVKAAKKDVEKLIEAVLESAQIEQQHLHTALGAGTATEKWGSGASDLAEEVAALQAAYDREKIANEAHQAVLAADDRTDEQVSAAVGELADAQVIFDDLFQEVLAASMREDELRRMLALSDELQFKKDPATNLKIRDADGEFIMLPSPRTVELGRLKDQYSEVADKLDDLVDTWGHYNSIRRGFDDAEDLKRLMRGAGVLEFRIAVEIGTNDPRIPIQTLRNDLRDRGPEAPTSDHAWWFPINDLKQWYNTENELASLTSDPEAFFARRELIAAEHDGTYYILLYDRDAQKLTRQSGPWQLKSASRTTDRLGRVAVSFHLDAPGGQKMRALTGNNVQKPMAIVLDGEVFSAPNINSPIGTDGIIEGTFSDQEISYLIRVLASGSLEARLSEAPIAENILGPSIGQDNLNAGLNACLVGVIAVAAFMLFYYFFAGVVANFALLCNAIIIFGILAMQQASFTLPGIAGIVLTIGMAVDANVLIYERIREEIFGGEDDLRTAIRLGYGKALSTIIDANVTNLIVCFALYYTATAEVKGFALTLSIGILATLFTSLFVTRVIFTLCTDMFKMKNLPMLPTVVPAVHRALEPSINWIGLRKFFVPVSTIFVVISLIMVFSRGVDMFDTEFRGGVSATMLTKQVNPDNSDEGRIKLERADVEERVRAISKVANSDDDPLANFKNAKVYAAGSHQEGTRSDSFLVKVALDTEDPSVMKNMIGTILEEFRDVLDVVPATHFKRSDQETAPPELVLPITDDRLGRVIDRPGLTINVAEFRGGVAVLIEDINPPTRIVDVERRMARMRLQPDFPVAVSRKPLVVGLDQVPDKDIYTSVVVLVKDDRYAYDVNQEIWESQLANVEWKLISQSLQQEATLERVSTYSASVAETLAANAVVAIGLSLIGILVYIWVRFGSFRYSLAAVVALVHDVSIGLGALALSHLIAAAWPANPLGIEPFLIDLGVVAGLLTIIGYSLNDTIVIMDRIRENRGKLSLATLTTVNRSINQTISRTVLTSVTTILAVTIMYAWGGAGIRPFAFTLLVGLFVGTYSSVAIAAPLVFRGDDRNGPAPATTGGLPSSDDSSEEVSDLSTAPA